MSQSDAHPVIKCLARHPEVKGQAGVRSPKNESLTLPPPNSLVPPSGGGTIPLAFLVLVCGVREGEGLLGVSVYEAPLWGLVFRCARCCMTPILRVYWAEDSVKTAVRFVFMSDWVNVCLSFIGSAFLRERKFVSGAVGRRPAFEMTCVPVRWPDFPLPSFRIPCLYRLLTRVLKMEGTLWVSAPHSWASHLVDTRDPQPCPNKHIHWGWGDTPNLPLQTHDAKCAAQHTMMYGNPPPPLCPDTGLSQHGDPVFLHFWAFLGGTIIFGVPVS